MNSNTGNTSLESVSVEAKPYDGRCKYWAKLVRAGGILPAPDAVSGANDIPSKYLARGDEELLPGDAFFEGEANHHRRSDRGWTYRLTYLSTEGLLYEFVSGFSEQKVQLKPQGLAPELLKGSGDIAAMVRIVHGLRAGMKLTT